MEKRIKKIKHNQKLSLCCCFFSRLIFQIWTFCRGGCCWSLPAVIICCFFSSFSLSPSIWIFIYYTLFRCGVCATICVCVFFPLSTWCVHFLSLSHDLPSLFIFIRLFKLSEFVFNRTWKRQTEAKNEKRSNVIYYKATSQNIFFGIIACIYYTYSKGINSPIRYVNK